MCCKKINKKTKTSKKLNLYDENTCIRKIDMLIINFKNNFIVLAIIKEYKHFSAIIKV